MKIDKNSVRQKILFGILLNIFFYGGAFFCAFDPVINHGFTYNPWDAFIQFSLFGSVFWVWLMIFYIWTIFDTKATNEKRKLEDIELRTKVKDV